MLAALSATGPALLITGLGLGFWALTDRLKRRWRGPTVIACLAFATWLMAFTSLLT